MMDIDAALRFLAEKNNLSVDEMRAEMEKAISAAKDNDNFKALFGDRIPSPEEFIQAVAMMLKTPDSPIQ